MKIKILPIIFGFLFICFILWNRLIRTYLPKNIIKETLLEIDGWELIRITSEEWFNTTYQDKRLLLLQKLSSFCSFKNLLQ